MISLPSQDDLVKLKSFHEPVCVTIYSPLIDPNGATNPSRLAIKNLLKDARQSLISEGVEPKQVKRILEPARALIDSYDFWPLRGGCVALFLHQKEFMAYHIPDYELASMVSIGRSFNLEPLQRAINNNRPFFVLALSHSNVRLLSGDRFNLTPLEVAGMPINLKQSLRIDEFPKSRQTHRVAPAIQGKRGESFHEQYDVSQVDKRMLLTFFRQVDRRLHKLLIKHDYPLIIAGVGYLHPIYRKANTYKGLAEVGIKGDTKKAGMGGLRNKAWRLVMGIK